MIELRGVTKQYLYGARLFGAVDMRVENGEIVALVGEKGSGKTSLLKVMAGVTDCEGEALIDGAPIGKRPYDVQLIFDDMAIFKNRSCYYNLAYPLKIRGFDKAQIDELVRAAAERLGITACLCERAKKTSNIDLKRLALARLYIRKASNILIDDITSELTAREAEELWSQAVPILLEKAKEGAAVIFSTESYDEALSIADKIAILCFGEIKQFGSADDISSAPHNVWAAQATDKYFRFERVGANIRDNKLILTTEDGYCLDATHLRDRLLPDYLDRPLLAGWHGINYAEVGARMERALYVVREGDYFVHATQSGHRVVLPYRRDEVCTLPVEDKIMLFDVRGENSVLK